MIPMAPLHPPSASELASQLHSLHDVQLLLGGIAVPLVLFFVFFVQLGPLLLGVLFLCDRSTFSALSMAASYETPGMA